MASYVAARCKIKPSCFAALQTRLLSVKHYVVKMALWMFLAANVS